MVPETLTAFREAAAGRRQKKKKKKGILVTLDSGKLKLGRGADSA
jgi:hypothetical protein